MYACCCRHPLSQLLLVSLMLLVYCCWLSVVDIPACALSMLLTTPLPCWDCCKSSCTTGINNICSKVFHQFP
jgi:hypothetical protein